MNTADDRPWQVDFTRKAQKQVEKLPGQIRDVAYLLKSELEQEGPVQPEWFHYGKLAGKNASTTIAI